ncbi:MAG: cytochrome c biosis protein transrane region [Alphaproteobacteria bacterium]|jgi:cytochrome c biogenesis protein CcdA|nr:cytochrome c biosis protein transrane region [Alphaproteobacteria bacterium]MDF3034463.1 cytochrome c biosis protein transrane region [Alphaproteobacteria bacterium]
MTLAALSFIAGVFTLLNPCAFPLIPIFLSSAWQRPRFGPLALILGLSLTFAVMGFALATSHMVLGLEIKKLRLISVFLLLGIGISLACQPLQVYLLQHGKPLAFKVRQTLYPISLKEFPLEKIAINFLIGTLLGFIWLPCTGPTLTLALALADRGDYFGQAYVLMSFYALGVTTPLFVLSYLSKTYMKKKKNVKQRPTGRKWLGYSLIFISFLILTGTDKAVESWTVAHSPQWLLKLMTKY